MPPVLCRPLIPLLSVVHAAGAVPPPHPLVICHAGGVVPPPHPLVICLACRRCGPGPPSPLLSDWPTHPPASGLARWLPHWPTHPPASGLARWLPHWPTHPPASGLARWLPLWPTHPPASGLARRLPLWPNHPPASPRMRRLTRLAVPAGGGRPAAAGDERKHTRPWSCHGLDVLWCASQAPAIDMRR